MTHSCRQIWFSIFLVLPSAALLLLAENRAALAQGGGTGLNATTNSLEQTLAEGGGRNQTASQAAGAQERQGSSGYPSSYPGGGDESDMDMEMMDDMDMDMESGYDSGYPGGYGGGGSSRSRAIATGTPQADAMQIYGSSLIGVRDGIDFSPLFAPLQAVTVESGPVLGREAEQAFKSGNHALALELMFGHMATEFIDARVAVQTVKYSKTLRRPVWAIRWGTSMAVRGEGVDPQPIREGATPSRQGFPVAGRGGGGDGFGMEEMEMQMEQSMEEEMDMDMAEMEMDMDMEMEMAMGGGSRRGAPGRGLAPSLPSIPVREMLSKDANESLDKTLGLVAKVVGEQFSKRFQRGDFGPVFATVSAPEPVETNRNSRTAAPAPVSMSAELNDALSDAAEPLPMWRPGIVFLGPVDAYADVIPVARSNNIDLVLHFDVVLKPGRNNTVQNISRCRLINVATGKSVGVSKGMDSREAAQLAGVGRMGERAYVEQQLDNMFAIIDRDVKVIDLPALTPDVARRRIASLISSPTSRTLRTLAEIRLYQARELIDEGDVETAFDIVGGVDALTLLHGARDQRIAMARQWAVASQGNDDR